MNINQFWEIIDTARNTAGAWQDMRAPMQASLDALSADEIAQWQGIYYKYHHLADQTKVLASARCILNGISDDGFTDFRAWLIAQGKETYLNTLANPDSLANNPSIQAFLNESIGVQYTPDNGFKHDPRFEDFGYLGRIAYQKQVENAPLKFATLSPEIEKEITSEVHYNNADQYTQDMVYIGDRNDFLDTFPQLAQFIESVQQKGQEVYKLPDHKMGFENIRNYEDLGKYTVKHDPLYQNASNPTEQALNFRAIGFEQHAKLQGAFTQIYNNQPMYVVENPNEIPKTQNTMDVLLIEPHKLPIEITIPQSESAVEALVQGEAWIHPYSDDLKRDTAVFYNADPYALQYNRTIKDNDHTIFDVLKGNIVICGIDKDGICGSLSEEAKKAMKDLFDQPEYITMKDNKIYSTPVPPLPDSKEQQPSNQRTIDVLFIEPHRLPKEITIPNTEQALETLVKGEVLEYSQSTVYSSAILINENQDNLPYNRTLTDNDQETALFCGNMIICGVDQNGQYCSLSEEAKKVMKDEFYHPECITIEDYEIQSRPVPPLPDKKEQKQEQQNKKTEPER